MTVTFNFSKNPINYMFKKSIQAETFSSLVGLQYFLWFKNFSCKNFKIYLPTVYLQFVSQMNTSNEVKKERFKKVNLI